MLWSLIERRGWGKVDVTFSDTRLLKGERWGDWDYRFKPRYSTRKIRELQKYVLPKRLEGEYSWAVLLARQPSAGLPGPCCGKLENVPEWQWPETRAARDRLAHIERAEYMKKLENLTARAIRLRSTDQGRH